MKSVSKCHILVIYVLVLLTKLKQIYKMIRFESIPSGVRELQRRTKKLRWVSWWISNLWRRPYSLLLILHLFSVVEEFLLFDVITIGLYSVIDPPSLFGSWRISNLWRRSYSLLLILHPFLVVWDGSYSNKVTFCENFLDRKAQGSNGFRRFYAETLCCCLDYTHMLLWISKSELYAQVVMK